ncbi:hypothetical protein DFH11DRAFT_1727964 [Phellopilus nigrolimitatus]|nr:hypothetical protein DFH11DRAFT_1727964 [Phellopilus nigrolimitatus]
MAWTDAEQLKFLTDLMADYYEAKKKGSTTVDAFIDKTFNDFCSRWPADTATFSRADIYKGTPEEVSRNKKLALQARIREWFKYHTRPKQSRGALSVLTLDGGKGKARTRMAHAIEAYDHLYVKNDPVKIKALGAAYETHKSDVADIGLEPLGKMQYRRHWLGEQLEMEPQELKTHVDLFRKTKVVKEAAVDLPDFTENMSEADLIAAERLRIIKVTEIQKKTDALGATLKTIGKELEEQLGAKGFFFVALPEPKAGGKLSVFKSEKGQQGTQHWDDATLSRTLSIDPVETAVLSDRGRRAFVMEEGVE